MDNLDKECVFTFGRFNPPTIGHKRVFEQLLNQKKEHFVFTSRTYNYKNPLTFETKIFFLESFFPDINFVKEDVPSPFQAMKFLSNNGYRNVTMVVGEDRVKNFKQIFETYNNHPDESKQFRFAKYDVISSGKRDGAGVEAVSASKARDFAVNEDYNKFSFLIPGNNDTLKKKLYTMVREGIFANETEKMKRLRDSLL